MVPTNCPDCERVLAPNVTECRCGWKLQPLERPVETTQQLLARFTPAALESERVARETAMRFGVDPSLPPKERALAVSKRVRLFGQPARERVPGEDDETAEVA